MNFMEKLQERSLRLNSLVCVGLDIHPEKMPESFQKELNVPSSVPQKQASVIFKFVREIIDATKDVAVVYKPNLAFYEDLGFAGEIVQTEITDYLRANNLLSIADAKRGDIGNTADRYASAILKKKGYDAITVNPYMGVEAVSPFTDYEDKGVFILCRTSNPSATATQRPILGDGKTYAEFIAKMAHEKWNGNHNVGLVVGAVNEKDGFNFLIAEEIASIREIAPKMTFLIPGIGAQGGLIRQTVQAAKDLISGTGFIINSSREITHASSGPDFAEKARENAIKLRDEINKYR